MGPTVNVRRGFFICWITLHQLKFFRSGIHKKIDIGTFCLNFAWCFNDLWCNKETSIFLTKWGKISSFFWNPNFRIGGERNTPNKWNMHPWMVAICREECNINDETVASSRRNFFVHEKCTKVREEWKYPLEILWRPPLCMPFRHKKSRQNRIKISCYSHLLHFPLDLGKDLHRHRTFHRAQPIGSTTR